MARIIQKGSGKDVLETIGWKEFVVIYVQSVIFNVFIVCKNVLWSLKQSLDTRIGSTRRVIAHKFPMLSLIKGAPVARVQQSVACPAQLLDPQLGQHKYMKLKTTKLHYVESGAENERLILLLHGFPDCFFGWRYQIPALSVHNRVIALDLKGFNDSDKPVLRHNYRPGLICEELKDFIDALNIKTVAIIGHDIGGLIGWMFALKFPDYVSKFVAISAPHPNFYWTSPQNALLSKSWRSMVQMPFLPERELNRTGDFIDPFYSHLFNERCAMELENGQRCGGKDLIATYKYIFNSNLDWNGPLNYFRNFIFYRIKPNNSIRCPCVIISGNEDPNYKIELTIKSSEFCENSMIKIIEGAGHFAHQSHWMEVNNILVKFLGGSKRKMDVVRDENLQAQVGIVGRMINKMYGVGQHYGNMSGNGKIFS